MTRDNGLSLDVNSQLGTGEPRMVDAVTCNSMDVSLSNVDVLKNINLRLVKNRFHGVIGRNGAGKSVLMNTIMGLHAIGRGELSIDGSKAIDHRYTPDKAKFLGVGMVPQEPLFAQNLSILDNLFLGTPSYARFGLLRRKDMRDKARDLVKRLGLSIDLEAAVQTITVEEQQLLAVAKAIEIERLSLVLLDEVTASLSAKRREMLFEYLSEAMVADQNLTLILVSHHINEILRFCDTVTVLRDGRLIGTYDTSEIDQADLAEMVIGPAGAAAEPDTNRALDAPAASSSMEEVCFEIVNARDNQRIDHVSCSVGRGEILGIAGLDGSGREEFLKGLAGASRLVCDRAFLNGRPLTYPVTPSASLRNGIVYLSKNRETDMVVPKFSVRDNMTFLEMSTRRPFSLIRRARLASRYQRLLDILPVKMRNLDVEIGTLSGGNRQKVILNRLLAVEPQVLVLDEPTRGIDMATKPTILERLKEYVSDGGSVVCSLESEDELVAFCDRIIVLFRGRVTGELVKNDPGFTADNVYRLSQGLSDRKEIM